MTGTGSSESEDFAARVLRDLGRHERERAPAPGLPRLARYELLDVLGEGATATVYRATDRELKRTVAVKVLRAGRISELGRERFRREARTAAGITHPNLVAVHDAGEEEGRAYLVMELVEGAGFGDGTRPREERLRLLEQAARGVAAAHAAGVVHRDLKPANLLVTKDGVVKVGDFGLAHLCDTKTELTRTGTTLGTPLYMAPEQVEGRPEAISPRTDVYALGAMLYEILSGRPPHAAEGLATLYARIVRDEPAPLPGQPRDLETVALKALEKDPLRRYADAGEFAEELRRHREGEPVRARPLGATARIVRRASRHRAVLSGTLLLLAALAAAGLLWRRADRMKGEIARLSASLPDPRPWQPVFDGSSMACFMVPNADWRIESGVLVNAVPAPRAMQTLRVFRDGELRVRFETRKVNYLSLSARLGIERRHSVEWDRSRLEALDGAVHELVFRCRGELVEAWLDGKAETVSAPAGPSHAGTLHFSCAGGGLLRIVAIDYRE